MERRSGLRKAIDMDVVLDSTPGQRVRGRIGNVGFGGLYVQVDSAKLSKDTPVELVLSLQHESGRRPCRIHAFVARLTPNGAGLVFDEYDVAAFRALVVLLLTEQAGRGNRAGVREVSFSNGNGLDAVAALEDTTKKAAVAAGSFVPVSQQPSPAQA